MTTRTGDAVPSSETVTAINDHPSEKKPADDTPYTVPASHPRRLIIPTIGVTSFIQPVGLEKSGRMATPNNIYFTGWYVTSPTPGGEGVSILNGHVGGRYNPGIFKDLKKLMKNDTMSVEMGDLSIQKFRVVSVKTYALAETAAPLFRDDPAIEGELHIITCDGVFDDDTQSYDNRLIVVAEHI